MRLREHTHKLLTDRPRTKSLRDVAQDTGLSHYWLIEFSRERIRAPCVDKVQTLFEYLSHDTDRLNFN